MILPPQGRDKEEEPDRGARKGGRADKEASKGIRRRLEDREKRGGGARKRSEKKGRKEPVFLGAFLFRGKDLKAVKPTNEQWAGPKAPPIARLDRLEGGYLVILAASSTNFFNPFSVKGCTSIPLMADRGAVTTSAPNRAHPVMCFTWRMEAARMRVSMA